MNVASIVLRYTSFDTIPDGCHPTFQLSIPQNAVGIERLLKETMVAKSISLEAFLKLCLEKKVDEIQKILGSTTQGKEPEVLSSQLLFFFSGSEPVVLESPSRILSGHYMSKDFKQMIKSFPSAPEHDAAVGGFMGDPKVISIEELRARRNKKSQKGE